MEPRSYKTPSAFKTALEARLRALASSEHTNLHRRRMLLIFDRFLARVVHEFADAIVLKGGLALELRLARARTTKDVDLRLEGSSATLLPRLQRAGRLDLGDFLSFEVTVDDHHPEINAAVYEGFRFRTVCQLAGKQYGTFGVDICFGDPMLTTPDEITSPDLLNFMGVLPPRIKVYPPETHLAEKLHAYTFPPRTSPNSRVKDLPDLVLLAQVGSYQAAHLRAAFAETFAFRKTHSVPATLPSPPEAWSDEYAHIARTDDLPWPSLAAVTDAAQRFLGPVLAGDERLIWSPKTWEWSPALPHLDAALRAPAPAQRLP